MATGSSKNQFETISRSADKIEYDSALRSHMITVYNYMCGGLLLTALVALFTASSPAMLQAIFDTPLKWVVMLAPFGFVMFLSFKIHSMSASKAQLLFWLFAGVMGLSMASIFIVYPIANIARVFFITSAMFAATSLYGYTTKKNLQGMGSFMMMGLFGIIIAMIVNIFIGSSALDFAISVIGVIVFTGLAAWDTQRIKEQFNQAYGTELVKKIAIMGALSLYLNFINLFMMMLRLFGGNRS